MGELRDVGLTHFASLPLSESHLDPSARLGVGVASRHPTSQRDRFVLDRPHLTASVRGERWVLHNKGMVGCALETLSAQPLWVYPLHLFPFFEFGVGEADSHVDRMWQEFWDYADGLVGRDQLVLAGDFNQQSRRHAARRWSKQNWQFCFERVGTTANGLALDEIVLNWPAAQPKTALVPTFSDHYLVTADVQLQNARSQVGARSGASTPPPAPPAVDNHPHPQVANSPDRTPARRAGKDVGGGADDSSCSHRHSAGRSYEEER